MQLPVQTKKVASISGISMGSSWSLEFSCQSTVFDTSKLQLQVTLDTLIGLRKEISHDGATAWRAVSWIKDPTNLMNPLYCTPQLMLVADLVLAS